MLQDAAKPLADVADAIKRAEVSGVLTQPAASIYRSMIHMHFNRVWGLDGGRELESLRYFAELESKLLCADPVPIVRKQF